MKMFRNAMTISCSAVFLVACSETAVPEVQKKSAESQVRREVVSKPVQTKPTAVSTTTTPAVKKRPVVKPGSLTSVDMGRLYTMKEAGEVLLIDVRPPLYYGLGHIPGAESFPLIKYDKMIAEKKGLLDSASKEGKVIVLYCQNIDCPDAHKTGVKLTKLGYSVSTYSGGWEEWKEAGL